MPGDVPSDRKLAEPEPEPEPEPGGRRTEAGHWVGCVAATAMDSVPTNQQKEVVVGPVGGVGNCPEQVAPRAAMAPIATISAIVISCTKRRLESRPLISASS